MAELNQLSNKVTYIFTESSIDNSMSVNHLKSDITATELSDLATELQKLTQNTIEKGRVTTSSELTL